MQRTSGRVDGAAPGFGARGAIGCDGLIGVALHVDGILLNACGLLVRALTLFGLEVGDEAGDVRAAVESG